VARFGHFAAKASLCDDKVVHFVLNFRLWLSTALLIAATGRPLCDQKAAIRANDCEWPIWVDFGHSAWPAGAY